MVYPWGEPASHALEETYSQDPDAFWGLKDYYFQNQSDIGNENVESETRGYIENNTNLDPEVVLTSMQNQGQREAVQIDLDASRNAGVRGTPTFYLFRDGEYITDILGPQSASVFRNSLGV